MSSKAIQALGDYPGANLNGGWYHVIGGVPDSNLAYRISVANYLGLLIVPGYGLSRNNSQIFFGQPAGSPTDYGGGFNQDTEVIFPGSHSLYLGRLSPTEPHVGFNPGTASVELIGTADIAPTLLLGIGTPTSAITLDPANNFFIYPDGTCFIKYDPTSQIWHVNGSTAVTSSFSLEGLYLREQVSSVSSYGTIDTVYGCFLVDSGGGAASVLFKYKEEGRCTVRKAGGDTNVVTLTTDAGVVFNSKAGVSTVSIVLSAAFESVDLVCKSNVVYEVNRY